MLFSLEVLPARKGDCLLLHCGDVNANDRQLIMIDGGPSQVYGPFLKPRLQEIRKKRGLDENTPLIADILMISHVDDDHIRGILELTKELITLKEEQKRQYLQINSLWHNSFENIIGQTPAELLAQFRKKYPTASADAEPPEDLEVESEHLEIN